MWPSLNIHRKRDREEYLQRLNRLNEVKTDPTLPPSTKRDLIENGYLDLGFSRVDARAAGLSAEAMAKRQDTLVSGATQREAADVAVTPLIPYLEDRNLVGALGSTIHSLYRFDGDFRSSPGDETRMAERRLEADVVQFLGAPENYWRALGASWAVQDALLMGNVEVAVAAWRAERDTVVKDPELLSNESFRNQVIRDHDQLALLCGRPGWVVAGLNSTEQLALQNLGALQWWDEPLAMPGMSDALDDLVQRGLVATKVRSHFRTTPVTTYKRTHTGDLAVQAIAARGLAGIDL